MALTIYNLSQNAPNNQGDIVNNGTPPGSLSLLRRLEGLKELLRTNVLPFLDPQGVGAYFWTHRGTGILNQTTHFAIQRNIHLYRPITTLKALRQSVRFNNGKLLQTSQCNYETTHLDCSDSDITDDELEKIVKAYPRLTSLNLTNCKKLTTLSMLKGLKLQSLNLSLTGIKDFSTLQFLTQLQILDLSGTYFEDSSPLQPLQHLHTLNLSFTNINDSAVLRQLRGLRTLCLSFTKIRDLAFLRELVHLQHLNISHNQHHGLHNIAFLEALTELRTLDLRMNLIRDISPLQHLIKLESLLLTYNLVEDLTPLRHLKQLQELQLDRNLIVNITPLRNLIRLRKLHLNGNPNLQNIFILTYLKELEELFLNETKIQNIAPLRYLKRLNRLWLGIGNFKGLSLLKPLVDRPGFDYSGTLIPTWHRLTRRITTSKNTSSSIPTRSKEPDQITPPLRSVTIAREQHVPVAQPKVRCSDFLLFVLDLNSTKIASLALSAIFGMKATITTAAVVGAYSYLRRRWTVQEG